MRIGIDGYNFSMPKGTGVATYGLSLSKALHDMGHSVEGVFGFDVGRQRDTRELLFFDGMGHGHRSEGRALMWRVAGELLSTIGGAQLHEVPLTTHVEKRGFDDRLPNFSRLSSAPYLFETSYARLKFFKSFLTVSVPNPPDIMHWTYPIPVRMKGSKNIYTVHDLVPLRLPYATLDDKQVYHRLVKWCVATGDHICTVSEASRDDILGRFPVPPEKVTNTYQTSPVPDDVAASNAADDARFVKGMFGLEQHGYFLFFGAIDPKKNINRIIDAFLTSGVKCPLVLVTARDWEKDQKVKAGVPSRLGSAIRSGGNILHIDYLPRSTLFRLIRTAKAVMFPSLFEGFGLPALEAIELGTPVIASNVSSLPEVVGEAGLLVDPYSTNDIAAAMRAIDDDGELHSRLVAAGRTQMAKFSEENYRARLAGMYAAALGC